MWKPSTGVKRLSLFVGVLVWLGFAIYILWQTASSYSGLKYEPKLTPRGEQVLQHFFDLNKSRLIGFSDKSLAEEAARNLGSLEQVEMALSNGLTERQIRAAQIARYKNSSTIHPWSYLEQKLRWKNIGILIGVLGTIISIVASIFVLAVAWLIDGFAQDHTKDS